MYVVKKVFFFNINLVLFINPEWIPTEGVPRYGLLDWSSSATVKTLCYIFFQAFKFVDVLHDIFFYDRRQFFLAVKKTTNLTSSIPTGYDRCGFLCYL